MGSHVFSGVPVVTPRSNCAKNLIVPGDVSCKRYRTIIVGWWLPFPGEKLQGRGKRLDLTWVPGLAWLIIWVSIAGGTAGSTRPRSSWRRTAYTARASSSLWLNIPLFTICFLFQQVSIYLLENQILPFFFENIMFSLTRYANIYSSSVPYDSTLPPCVYFTY